MKSAVLWGITPCSPLELHRFISPKIAFYISGVYSNVYLITVSFIFRSSINVYAARTRNPSNAFCAKTPRKNVHWQDEEK